MKTQIAHVAGRIVVVTGLAVALTISGLSLARAEHADKANYFVQHPGSAGGRTGVDAHDLYAPVDLSPVLVVDSSTLVVGRFTAATEIGVEWAVPPTPGLPGRPY